MSDFKSQKPKPAWVTATKTVVSADNPKDPIPERTGVFSEGWMERGNKANTVGRDTDASVSITARGRNRDEKRRTLAITDQTKNIKKK